MLTKTPNLRLAGLFALLVFLCFVPILGEHLPFVLVLTYINVLLASSMQISYSVGLWNFGIVGFMALGAYASSLLISGLGVPFVVALLASGLVGSIASFLVGLPSLRLRGVYFLLLTVGFTEMVRSVLIKWLPNRVYVPPITIGGIEFAGRLQYYTILGITLLILYVVYRLGQSRLGLTWKSIKQSEGLARAVGVNIYQFKIINFVISSFIAGVAGSLNAHVTGLVTPWSFTFKLMMFIAIWNFVGGIDHFSGPIIGAFILTLLVEPLSKLAYYESIAYAVTIIVIVLFLPGGLVTLPREIGSWVSRLRPRRKEKDVGRISSQG